MELPQIPSVSKTTLDLCPFLISIEHLCVACSVWAWEGVTLLWPRPTPSHTSNFLLWPSEPSSSALFSFPWSPCPLKETVSLNQMTAYFHTGGCPLHLKLSEESINAAHESLPTNSWGLVFLETWIRNTHPAGWGTQPWTPCYPLLTKSLVEVIRTSGKHSQLPLLILAIHVQVKNVGRAGALDHLPLTRRIPALPPVHSRAIAHACSNVGLKNKDAGNQLREPKLVTLSGDHTCRVQWWPLRGSPLRGS